MPALARFFQALGDETRLGLVSLLAQQEPGNALCVGRLAQELGVSPSADCTPGQIRGCHGDAQEHECEKRETEPA